MGYTVFMGYKIGAYNMDRWLFQSAGQIPFIFFLEPSYAQRQTL